mgnify:CR=1 FL=1
MTFELLLTYATLLLLIVLILIYYDKEKFKNSKTTCYKVLIWLELVFIISELISILGRKYLASDILDTVFCKMHWIIGIIWFIILEYYFSIIVNNTKAEKFIDVIKSTLLNKILGVLSIIILIVYILLDHNPYDMNNLIFVDDTVGLVIGAFYIILAAIILLSVYKNKANINKDDRFTIVFTLIYSVFTMGVQIIFKDISFIPFGYLIILYSIYFNSEDPDIAISREINSAQTTIEQSNKTKTDFLSNMTFEIKTPMNLITSLCDDLRTMPTFDEATIREDIEQDRKLQEHANKSKALQQQILKAMGDKGTF